MAAVLGVVRAVRAAGVALLLLLAAAACARADDPAQKVEAAAPQRKPNADAEAGKGVPAQGAAERRSVLVFGDSISAGYGMRVSESWPSLLQTRLGDAFTVVNASVSGETTAGGLTRLPAALREHHPAIVILELGANDGLRGLPLPAAEKNLARMIELSQAAGAKVLLVSMQLPPNLGEAYTGKFRALFTTLATRYHLPVPPFLLEGVADNRELFQADQIHPVASAQPQLVDNVYPALLQLARR
jgi:acyl-CoA thioesterase-1